MRVHKLTNVTTALKVLEKNKVSLHFLTNVSINLMLQAPKATHEHLTLRQPTGI